MRFLVTGGTGFIGSNMVELLLGRGWEVVCPVRNPRVLRNLEGIPAQILSFESLQSEISEGQGFDYVVHVAGATRALDYQGYHSANVEVTRNLLELLAAQDPGKRPKRFVLVSSQAATGPCLEEDSCVVESGPYCPISSYGRSKAAAEQVALSYQDRVPVTVIRPPTVFGPRDVDVLSVFKCAKYGLAPCLAGPDRLVSIIYSKDLVEGILQAALSPKAEGEVYFLANREPVVWREFALLVAKVLGYKAMAVRIPLFAMKIAALAGDVMAKFKVAAPLLRSEKFEEMKQIAWVCSSEKAYHDLNWTPSTSMEKAIRETGRWYSDHGWL
jgi:nucleoside-diphosphate-sugar epimerase